MARSTHTLLIPPKRTTSLPGTLKLSAACVLASPSAADLLPLGQLADDLSRLGVKATIHRNALGPAGVRVRRAPKLAFRGLDSAAAVAGDAYRLEITPDGATITATADRGAYYGVQTLRELLAVHGSQLPCQIIEDWPDFARRGVYHDCSRGKVPTVATLKALVERLARWKINELQLYVENVFTFHRHGAIGKGFSPFTPEELLDVQDHCRRHHVRFVGSLSSFGHMEKTLCLPEYRHLAETPDGAVAGFWGLMSLCATDPAAAKFIGELYDEFLPLFEAVDFNICCDETFDLGKGRSKARAEKIGKGQVYLDFILKLYAHGQRHGKRVNMWSDILLEHPELLPQLPRDLVMLNWDYDINGRRIARSREIADAGLPQVCCPGTNGWQSHGSRMHESMGNVRQFAAEGRKCKAEGLLNTDWGDGLHRNFLGVSLHGFAHGAAQSWNGAAVPSDQAAFTRTFCHHAFGGDETFTDKLAAAMGLLGNSYLLCRDKPVCNGELYWAIMEPLRDASKGLDFAIAGHRINNLHAPGLLQIIEQLSDPSIWPSPPTGMDAFERTAMREFVVASEMETLACYRGLSGLVLRAGHTLPARDLRALAAATARVAGHFSDLWLARNKPSRLSDNMKRFRRMEMEAKKLAGT